MTRPDWFSQDQFDWRKKAMSKRLLLAIKACQLHVWDRASKLWAWLEDVAVETAWAQLSTKKAHMFSSLKHVTWQQQPGLLCVEAGMFLHVLHFPTANLLVAASWFYSSRASSRWRGQDHVFLCFWNRFCLLWLNSRFSEIWFVSVNS